MAASIFESAASRGQLTLALPKGSHEATAAGNSVPTLVSALIPKQHVFGVFIGQSESEIVVDPHRLRRLRHLELRQEAESVIALAAE